MGGGITSHPQPGGQRCAAPHRWQAEIEDDQGKTGVDQQFGGGQGVTEILRSQPQQPLEVDPDLRRRLWVQLRTLVDDGRRLAGAGHRPQGRQERRETPTGTPTHELHQLTPGQTAAEQVVEAGQRGGKGVLAESGRRSAGA